MSLKRQYLIDFIAELPQKQVRIDTTDQWWILHVDGALRTSKAGVGLMLSSPTREQIEQFVCLNFLVSNNKIEYKAIIIGLDFVLVLETTKMEV